MELNLNSYMCLHGTQKDSFTFYRIRVLTKPETIPNLAEVLVNMESSPNVSNYFKNL
jgi:hypothetical protein